MQRLLGVCEILAAVVILCIAMFLSKDISELYGRQDAQKVSTALKACSASTSELAKNYEHFHNETLPQIKNSIAASRSFISKLKDPCDLLYSLACWNFKIPNIKIPQTKNVLKFISGIKIENDIIYPFKKFQAPIRTFKEENIPAYRKSLENTEKIIDEFHGGTSENVLKTIPRVAESLNNVSDIIQKQQDLNQRISIYVVILGTVCSLLLLLSGICHLRMGKKSIPA